MGSFEFIYSQVSADLNIIKYELFEDDRIPYAYLVISNCYIRSSIGAESSLPFILLCGCWPKHL